MRTQSTLALATVFIAVSLNSISALAQEHASWGYEGSAGPENWYALDSNYHACGDGKNQSPIDLNGFIEATLPRINIDYRAAVTDLVNNGHTIQANVGQGNAITFNHRRYKLLQFHFHSPSENSINGKTYPMEIHYVHADKNNNLVVLSVMVNEGSENSSLQKIWDKMPSTTGKLEKFLEKISSVNLLPEDRAYYRYNGSLTTPPCTEGVTWFVLKHPIEASKSQISLFAHVLHHPNNRPQQIMGARLVLE